MTVTINCVTPLITIQSLEFSIANLAVRVKVAYQCKDEVILTIPLVATSFNITPTLLGMGTKFKDGVYRLILEVTKNTSVVLTETECSFVNCTQECKLVFKEDDPDSVERSLAFVALTLSNNCSVCSCADLCELYTFTQKTTCHDCACGCE